MAFVNAATVRPPSSYSGYASPGFAGAGFSSPGFVGSPPRLGHVRPEGRRSRTSLSPVMSQAPLGPLLQRHEPGVLGKWAQCPSTASQHRVGAGARPGVAGSSLSAGDRLARAPASGAELGLATGSDWTICAAASTAVWKDFEILTGIYHILARCSSEYTGDACTCGQAHVGHRGGNRLRSRGEGGRS